ncbi:mannose-6-phosphate isomerase [Asanoa ferruginea]|uniref:Mannose-6-phosphate isomerase n=1 Tax=Asanoa ferruginea TaxID=53367 RepID=A0A3D9ZTK6_9ACTN|nr:class I mannose-6-phosphate isomerase [Asanoa ferruginea]REF99323.1 mannose-6-phosphate isomerase [Asanoa ferruginea]GIF45925.1 mannose-6-phosphate isomerase [Asanoa ferruginea]
MTVIVLPVNQPADRFYLGGDRIAAFRGSAPAGDHTPEDWVGSTTTVAGFDSLGLTVLDDGRLLRAAIADDPVRWLGAAHVARFGADPALLVKLLDAGERLPVHVHPDDAFAQSHLGCRNGKTESWIILDAEPGAKVHLGFREDVEPATLADWVARQDRAAMLDALHAVEVTAGDTVFVPAGYAHAIGAGILLLELQQAADLSLLLEYDGFAIDGPRDGHLGIGFDAALPCVRRQAVPAGTLKELCGRIDDTRIFPAYGDAFFRAIHHSGPSEWEPGFSIAVVLSGEGRLSWGADESLALRTGMTVLIPHDAGTVRVEGPVELVRCRPPVA